MLRRVVRLFSSNRATTRDVLGNVVIGDVNGILIQAVNSGPPPEPLYLPWHDPVAGTEFLDVFNLLSWRCRLAPVLVGRDEAFDGLLDWARNDQRAVAIRLLSGPGGAGK